MIHAMKPNPKSNVQEWWRIMDYLSYIPESTHMFFWWLDDWGVPSDYRHMDGYAVHTFKVLKNLSLLIYFHSDLHPHDPRNSDGRRAGLWQIRPRQPRISYIKHFDSILNYS